ncbi:hypothetical protein [Roseicitreum antarcticum]|uniref:Uncharacterized protein n=1 Tax=Roseicitreum antarcticum TaxID=564137 RepID=A0A1H2TS46_9RHOB|nr:hypothetical protein [Roseicitreum antarcticum]SDW46558.1 hypothetical protein SAMN04488238_102152 [Roseicitreum antarcticum]
MKTARWSLAPLAFTVAGALAAPGALGASTLTVFANGEELATQGFTAPQTTRDGWTLSFTRILATFGQITAWQTDAPFMADGPEITGAALLVAGRFTVDLTDADNRVALATAPAEPGHYNALSWALTPAMDGPAAGFSLLLEGVARKGGTEVPFTLRSADRVLHACGEYLGDARKGFVDDDSGADLEITLHLDHLFGRGDRGAADPMNIAARGFDPFAGGGVQEFTLAGLHLGHVGEGHCHVSAE